MEGSEGYIYTAFKSWPNRGGTAGSILFKRYIRTQLGALLLDFDWSIPLSLPNYVGS